MAYAATVALFLWVMAGFYLPGQGFTAMLVLGDHFAERAIPSLRAQNPYVEPESYGYDGQFYVQLAMQPDLRDDALPGAIDNLPYRARRILMSWAAWALGGGDPGRVMHVYSVLNLGCWLALAVLLLRWFPPDSWNNYLRWAGVLLSSGLCFSVRASLPDGPSLLMIAVAFMVLESGRPWWATIVLGASGLLRETNVLAAALFAPVARRAPVAWLKSVLQGAIIVAPCLLWVAYLRHLFDSSGVGLGGNFDLPLRAFLLKWQAVWTELSQRGLGIPNDRSLLMMVSLTVQAAFLLMRPRWSDAWWRLGAAYFVLMAMLGMAVWEGYPGAAGRVLLPMGLAFNVLVPRGRRWLAILVLGNATIFTSLQSLSYPAGASYVIAGAEALPQGRGQASDWKVEFLGDWAPARRSHWEYWRWSRGDAQIAILNPSGQPADASIRFELKSRDVRTVSIRRGEQLLWCGSVNTRLQEIRLDPVQLEPGRDVWSFTTESRDGPSASADRPDTLCLRNLRIELHRPARQ